MEEHTQEPRKSTKGGRVGNKALKRNNNQGKKGIQYHQQTSGAIRLKIGNWFWSVGHCWPTWILFLHSSLSPSTRVKARLDVYATK